MLDRCPVCRAKLNESLLCRRCGSDLSFPQRIYEEAERHYVQSITDYRQGDYEAARLAIEQALQLKQNQLYSLWQKFITSDAR